MVISPWLPVSVSFCCVDYVYANTDENSLSLSLTAAITWKNTQITQFPRFVGKILCICKWLKPGVLSAIGSLLSVNSWV